MQLRAATHEGTQETRPCVCVTGGTHGTSNESQPSVARHTCRKSQPPIANIILIAIEKYRHYLETLFSFGFAAARRTNERHAGRPARVEIATGGGQASRRPPHAENRPDVAQSSDTVTRRTQRVKRVNNKFDDRWELVGADGFNRSRCGSVSQSPI